MRPVALIGGIHGCDGWWQPAVAAGEEAATGQLVGTLRTLYGDVLEELHASSDGVVLFPDDEPAVGSGGPLLGLGTDVTTQAGTRTNLVPRRGPGSCLCLRLWKKRHRSGADASLTRHAFQA